MTPWILVSAAYGASLDVPGAYATLTSAFAVANPGDEILVDASLPALAPETVTVSVSGVTVRGINGVPTLQPSTAASGVFLVGSGHDLVLQDLVLDGLGTSRVVNLSAGSVTLERVDVVAGGYPGSGGAIYANGDLTVRDCTFTQSRATGDGGAIAVAGGDLVIDGTDFSDSVTSGDGGHVHVDGNGTVAVSGSWFRSGEADRGGALNLRSNGLITVSTSTFGANVAFGNRGGGALYIESAGVVTVSSCVFEDNVGSDPAGRGGGAIYQENGSTSLVANTFCDNQSAVRGGAVYDHNGAAITSENDVYLQNGAVEGGAIWVRSGSMDVAHGSFAQNEASVGQAMGAEGVLTVRDTYVFEHTLQSVPAIPAIDEVGGTIEVSTSGFDNNPDGDFDAGTQDGGGNLRPANAGITPPVDNTCDRIDLTPPPGTPLDGMASDGGTIGALDPAPPDEDGDGYLIPDDCADDDATVFPGAPEVIADGIDQDCDGGDQCWLDADGDTFGVPIDIPSDDLDCDDLNESSNVDESCPNFDDRLDADADGVPDGCDVCPLGPDDVDADADTVPDGCDVCPGQDDLLDADSDGIPNGCDDCDDASGDTDGDGVPDDCDVCPGGDDTVDSDGDGIPDFCDPATGTGTGTGTATGTGGRSFDDEVGAGDGCGCATGSGSAGWLAAPLWLLVVGQRKRDAR